MAKQSLITAIKAAKGESIDEPDDVDKKLALLKQNIGQNRNEQVNLTYSEETVKQAIKNIVEPLLAAWETKLKDFDSLFYNRNVSLEITYENTSYTEHFRGKCFTEIEIPSFKDETFERKTAKQITAQITTNGFAGTAQNISFLGGKITFQFYENACAINVNRDTKSISKLYHQRLNEDETQSIVQTLAGFLYDNISKHIELD